ncbi:MAG TPA: hypothetical protein VM165_10155 [Planctomycetaceae bacterium]|nr:hypothetical protein [Planctomycetaceae bacterium]
MPRNGTVSITVVMTAILVASSVAVACPFCVPPPPTLAEQLAESDVAVIAEWARSEPASDDQPEPRIDFRVVEVLRTTDDGPKKAGIVSVSFFIEAKPGDLFLLLAKRPEGIADWGQPIEVTEISAAYAKQTPSIERPAKERLPFFVRFLESSDQLLANDAFAEFGGAKYEDVVAIKDRLSREKIRQWLENPGTPPMRLGFYGMLLGLCGNAEDAEFLAAKVFPATPADKFAIGLDGMMAGYVLLTGERGLNRLVEQKLNDPKQPDGDVYAVINLLRFLWQFAPDRVPQAKVAAALRPLVDRPQFAEVAIVDLARWKEWSVLDQVIARYGQPPFETPEAKRKAITFALACIKDGGNDPQPGTPAKQARQFIERLRADDPETLRNAERFFRPSVSGESPVVRGKTPSPLTTDH